MSFINVAFLQDVRKKDTGYPEAKQCPPYVVSWGVMNI